MTHPPLSDVSAQSNTTLNEIALTAIAQALSGMRYGQVTITVQDGRILQIDRTDRRRLQPPVTTPELPAIRDELT